MPVTLIVEPDNGGHRFQSVAWIAEYASTDEVVLLTSHGARQRPEFTAYLSDVQLDVREVFDGVHPATRAMAHEVAEFCRGNDVAIVLVMDADQALKRWWLVAPAEFRGLPRRPGVVFMLTRYPARVPLTDRTGWKLRTSKATLAVLARATGSLRRVVGYAGRGDLSRGWIVQRVRDPAICTAHSRDRAAIRQRLGLPADAKLVGVFGLVSGRKNAPLILDAIRAGRAGATLVLAGSVRPEVNEWLDGLDADARARVLVRDGFLSNQDLDSYVAAADVVVLALTNNGPSGIMGKALAAGVPVVSAGSEVRAHELAVTGGGRAADLTAEGIGAAIDDLLAHGLPAPGPDTVPPTSPAEYAAVLLGVDHAPAPRRLARRR